MTLDELFRCAAAATRQKVLVQFCEDGLFLTAQAFRLNVGAESPPLADYIHGFGARTIAGATPADFARAVGLVLIRAGWTEEHALSAVLAVTLAREGRAG